MMSQRHRKALISDAHMLAGRQTACRKYANIGYTVNPSLAVHLNVLAFTFADFVWVRIIHVYLHLFQLEMSRAANTHTRFGKYLEDQSWQV